MQPNGCNVFLILTKEMLDHAPANIIPPCAAVPAAAATVGGGVDNLTPFHGVVLIGALHAGNARRRMSRVTFGTAHSEEAACLPPHITSLPCPR